MPDHEDALPISRRHLPSMTSEYSRLSDTARAVDGSVLPRIQSYLESIRSAIAGMPAGRPFVIADYGAADGGNSSRLFESVIEYIREVNPSLRIRLVYIDIADQAPFTRFWAGSHLSALSNVEAEYIRRSFYEPFPELRGVVNIGYSSTALHWLDTGAADADLFRHPACIQPNQLPTSERGKFVERWRGDWRSFFRERSRELADGGLLLVATLADLGGDRWPASAGYDNLRDVCCALRREGRISQEELEAIFIPGYFAAPEEIRSLIDEDAVGQGFSLRLFDAMTVPCAYFSRAEDRLEDPRERRRLADSLAQVVRAWSETSVRVGLSSEDAGLLDEIYGRMADRFFEEPRGLPYHYCLIELFKAHGSPR